MASEPRRLAVLGSPIAHSKSPGLHRAAYRTLGLDWEYSAVEVDGSNLAAFLDSRDESWRGLSLTMPLKHDVIVALASTGSIQLLFGPASTFSRVQT